MGWALLWRSPIRNRKRMRALDGYAQAPIRNEMGTKLSSREGPDPTGVAVGGV